MGNKCLTSMLITLGVLSSIPPAFSSENLDIVTYKVGDTVLVKGKEQNAIGECIFSGVVYDGRISVMSSRKIEQVMLTNLGERKVSGKEESVYFSYATFFPLSEGLSVRCGKAKLKINKTLRYKELRLSPYEDSGFSLGKIN